MDAPSWNCGKVILDAEGPPRYEQIAKQIEDAVLCGTLRSGDRLPAVRRLAEQLGVSVTTVTAAFDILRERGFITPEVGRGTFIAERPAPPKTQEWQPTQGAVQRSKFSGPPTPWRRRMLNSFAERLKNSFPQAHECRTGRTDPGLFPLPVIRRSFELCLRELTAQELQYSGPEPVQRLVDPLLRLLHADEIAARSEDLMVGSSSQQFLSLVSDLLVRQHGVGNVLVAVEEPGYPTAMDTFERAGATLIGMAVDHEGATPVALDAALAAGAKAVLFSPRAHNPTGAAWSSKRRASLADVLAGYSGVIAIEDDQIADVASTRPGSLLSDSRLEDRVVYVRSFSKTIGPDLRVAVGAARPVLKRPITEAKVFADGWTSRISQRALASILSDPELPRLLAQARDVYRERRERAAKAINALLVGHGAGTWAGSEGVSLWIQLPPSIEASEVCEGAAIAGARIDPGDPFYVQPGHGDCVRLNVGLIPTESAAAVGTLVAEVILACRPQDSAPLYV